VKSVAMADVSRLMRRPTALYDAYLFDLDGTIYLGQELLPGAKELIDELHRQGKRTIFLSNNPTKDPPMYVDKLRGLGILADLDDIVNTVVSTVLWLQANYPGATVFPLADEPLVRALRDAGFVISDDPALIDVVIASYDHSFDYRKLQIAFDALWFHKRAILITTNPDRYCPFPAGRGEPDAAGIVAAIEATTGVRCQANMGKPDRIMIDTVRARLGKNATRVLMVGDRLATDIQMGIAAGIDSALVLTGDSTLADCEAEPKGNWPTYVLDRIDGLLPEK
jgi:HAD superfamily hydrolase (TIGR01450 family)